MVAKLKMHLRKFLVIFVSENYQIYLFSKNVVCDEEGNGARRKGKS